ncbi:MAG: hypothetical protein ACOYOF_08125 [Verrucomicrobiaceae bacterium]
MPRFLTFLLVGFIAACGPLARNNVVLTTDDGTKKLTYDCSNLRPQVESNEQIQILIQAGVRAHHHALKRERMVTARAIMEAHLARDFRRLESLVVEYYCAHRDEL